MSPARADKLDELTAVSVAKRQWEKTFDAISDPLMIIDHDFVVRRANLALADDLGVAIQRVVGRKCHDLRGQSARAFPGARGRPCEGCPVPRSRETGGPEDGELRAPPGRIYRLRAYPLEDGASSMVVCSYRDITDEREMTRQLSSAEKLAAIGRLAGGVAHEINNPLTAILAFSQILLKQDCPADERLEYLQEIEKSALRCKGIVESLLRFSRQSPQLQRRPLSLNEVVEEALRFVDYKYAVQDVEVRCQLAEGLPLVLGNPNQLEQVLVNLLSNAFDSITAGPGAGGGVIEVRTTAQGGHVLLEVADDGSGIAEEHLPRLFDPFFTTKEEGKGTGLGLAVTYAIVREHNGKITARNRPPPERGAVFAVTLPVPR